MRIASFDIGKKNFAFCIEEFDELELSELVTPTVKYNPNGTATDAQREILEKVYSNGNIILHRNENLTKNCDPKKSLDPETFHNMTELLQEYSEYWDECDTIVIERQMSFGKKLNLMAVKLAQHLYSFFVIKYGRKIPIVEFDSFHKTQVLGAPKMASYTKKGKLKYISLSPVQRKKWAVDKCKEILEIRGETDAIESMLESTELTKTGRVKKKKLDDLGDVVCQANAYKYLAFVEKREL